MNMNTNSNSMSGLLDRVVDAHGGLERWRTKPLHSFLSHCVHYIYSIDLHLQTSYIQYWLLLRLYVYKKINNIINSC
jgi:hypothetical protein